MVITILQQCKQQQTRVCLFRWEWIKTFFQKKSIWIWVRPHSCQNLSKPKGSKNSYKGYQMWNAEDSSNRMSWKCASIVFSSIWPHIIHSAVKLSILMCHTIHFQRIFQMSSIGSIELYWAENEPVTFLPNFDPILFMVQSNYQFWCATLYTFNEFLKWAPKSAQLSSTELKMSQ